MRSFAADLFLEIEIAELLPAGVLHNEGGTGAGVLDRLGRRRLALKLGRVLANPSCPPYPQKQR